MVPIATSMVSRSVFLGLLSFPEGVWDPTPGRAGWEVWRRPTCLLGPKAVLGLSDPFRGWKLGSVLIRRGE